MKKEIMKMNSQMYLVIGILNLFTFIFASLTENQMFMIKTIGVFVILIWGRVTGAFSFKK